MYTKIKHSNLSSWKLNYLINEWVYNTPARVCAQKLHCNKNTVDLWYQRIREGIAALPDPEPFSGIVEVDETYIGKRDPMIQATGGYGKVPIFGMKERTSKQVWATVVSHTDHTQLIPLVQHHVIPGSTIYSDGYGAYYHLSKHGYIHHIVMHEHTHVSQFGVHTNGIESFWAYFKHLLKSRKGISRNYYQLHLKEAEKRFNTSEPRILRLVVRKILRNWH